MVVTNKNTMNHELCSLVKVDSEGKIYYTG